MSKNVCGSIMLVKMERSRLSVLNNKTLKKRTERQVRAALTTTKTEIKPSNAVEKLFFFHFPRCCRCCCCCYGGGEVEVMVAEITGEKK